MKIINKELELTHGEIYVDIFAKKKSVIWNEDRQSSGFKQEIYVQLMESFDEVTISLNVVQYDFNIWEVEPTWTIVDSGTAEDWDWAIETTEALMTHGFIDALSKVINE